MGIEAAWPSTKPDALARMGARGLKLLVAVLVVGRLTASEPPQGFSTLFNGLNLEGWQVAATSNAGKASRWRAEGGELIHDGGKGDAITVRDYGDFELRGEYRSAS